MVHVDWPALDENGINISTINANPSTNETEADEASAELPNDEDEDYNEAIAYNLSVYVAADKFGILPLKDLATKWFTSWVRDNITSVNLAEIVRGAMLCLPSHDHDLKDALDQVLADHVEDVIGLEGMMSVLVEFGSLAPALLKKLMAEKTEKGADDKIFCVGQQT